MTRLRHQLARWWPLWIAVALGALRAIDRWQRNKPEWRDFRELATHPLAQVSHADAQAFGYAPGAKALLLPFVASEPAGYLVFLLVNVASALGCVWLVREHLARAAWAEMPEAERDRWTALCFGVPVYFALQNNQIVAPALCLLLLGVRALLGARPVRAVVAFAISILLKSLPLAILGYCALAGRARAALAALALTLGLSLGLAAWTDGAGESLHAHLRYPAQLAAQSPLRVLARGAAPASLDDNQSLLAHAVRLDAGNDTPAFTWLFALLSLGLIAGLLRRTWTWRLEPDRQWFAIALWLAFVAYATPFGRYYYLLFCAPAWCWLGASVLRHTTSPGLRTCVWAAPLLPFIEPRWTYGAVAALTLFASLVAAPPDRTRATGHPR